MIIGDIKEKILHYSSWTAPHVRREVNAIAHILVKTALSVTDTIVNMEDHPSCICSFIHTSYLIILFSFQIKKVNKVQVSIIICYLLKQVVQLVRC